MAYADDILALSPDHVWAFDGDSLDSVGVLNATGAGISLGSQLTEDASDSLRSDGTSDRITLPSASTVDQGVSRKAIGGWVNVSSVQPPPKSIYREGTTGANQFCFVCWAGNNVMLDIVNNNAVSQLFTSRSLAPGRTFHLFATWSGTSFDDTIELFLDGVSQGSASAGSASFPARTAGQFSDPSGSTQVGNQNVLLNGLVNCDYQYWASWADKTLPTPAEIREELFEKGALPGVTISSDTEANMQSALNAISNTTRGDEPLNVRVEDVTGGGTLNLTADNITHDELASIHVQFVGTGTLNWTNINGSNSSIGSTPNGGTLNFLNPAVLTISPLVSDSEVRAYESGTTTEVAGVESSSTSFQASVSVNAVDVVVHKEDYEYVRIDGVDTSSGDVTVPISQVFDRNYENP